MENVSENTIFQKLLESEDWQKCVGDLLGEPSEESDYSSNDPRVRIRNFVSSGPRSGKKMLDGPNGSL